MGTHIEEQVIYAMSNTAACRILVVSPTLDRAKELIQRMFHPTLRLTWIPSSMICIGVKDLSDSQHGTNKIPSTSTLTKSVEPSGETSSSDASASSIPWTITNKYYTANIHFETHTFEQFGSHHASGVPAVIYVWSHGEVSILPPMLIQI